MSAEALAGFRRTVLDDPVLQAALLAVHDRREFVELVVRLAQARGWEVVPQDVEERLRASRRSWQERWI
jgi:hypothetical protein